MFQKVLLLVVRSLAGMESELSRTLENSMDLTAVSRAGNKVSKKVILGNKMPIVEEEMVDYLIEGVPERRLQDQACLMSFD